MTLTVTIEMDNAAFEPNPAREACRILRSIAPGEIQLAIRQRCTVGARQLLDVNGNAIGRYEVTP
ncbi:MAG TPA: hypothetical protein VFD92_04795 [Candidatus Binatia bacterium]|nr:hypothetical protein [Candidatus Binatia bacterium]